METEKFLKVVFILFFINVYLLACFKIQPYKTNPLNNQAIFSCLAMIATVGILSDLENSKISHFLQDLLLVFLLILNGVFLVYSAIIMLSDFKQIIKCKILKHCMFFPYLQRYISENARKEFRAKKKWRSLKQVL